MKLLSNFYENISDVLDNGVFGISLLDLGIIFISIIFALLVRSIFAKLIVSKLKKIVKNDFGKDPIIGRDLLKIKI